MRRIARRGWRQLSVLVALLLALSYLLHSLFVMQVLEAGDAAMLRHYREEVVSPQTEQPVRGTIVDASGLPLVNTVTVFKLGAYPYLVSDARAAARAITTIMFPLQVPAGAAQRTIDAAHRAQTTHYEAILAQLRAPYSYVCLAGDDSYTCPLQDDISAQQAQQIEHLKMAGFDLEPRNRPYYPDGPEAAHLLGFVNYAYPKGQAVDQGRYGLEEQYNSLLRGIAGHVAVRQDTRGNAIRVGPGSNTAGQQGAQLRLYLDSYIQYQVEQILFRTLQQWNAESGTVVVERPSDGAILAMASWPRYDPGKWQDILKADPKNGFTRFQNPAISALYDPGSTFKSIMAAIGLNSGSFNQNTPVYVPTQIAVSGVPIQDWCLNACSYVGTSLTVDTMLHYSSNIAANELEELIPTNTFYSYLHDFGFGQLTGVDLAGEVRGGFIDPNSTNPVFEPIDKATIAYGQGISVTPLQLANAYSALANGGYLMTPHVVDSSTLDGRTTVTQPRVRRQVISGDTSTEISDILVHSAIDGEACRALVPGYDVAAKTGTTTLYDGSNLTIASTAAYGPVNMPPDQRFVVLLIVHKPLGSPYGSFTASPAVHDILQLLFSYYHRPPNQGTVVQPATRCDTPLAAN